MANIVDRVFGEVCLDERIKDGIFRMEEEEHMNALRDYFVKRGIAKEAAVSVTNRMVEGKYPERQAYNKDGILVTFPTPQHKAKAIQRGTHFEKNPAPQNTTPPRPEAEPAEKPMPKGGNEFDDGPPKDEPKDDEEDGGKSLPKSSGGNIFDDEKGSKKEPTTGGELDIEPPRGAEKPEPTPAPPQPIQQAPLAVILLGID